MDQIEAELATLIRTNALVHAAMMLHQYEGASYEDFLKIAVVGLAKRNAALQQDILVLHQIMGPVILVRTT